MIRMLAPALLFVLATPLFCPAATLYVDDSAPTSGDGKSWETAFKSIQEGVEACSDGDTVLVAEGVYWGIRFEGRNVTLLSTDPSDPAVVAGTVIDVRGHGIGVTFDGTEDETCILSGFTITNGSASSLLYAGAAVRGQGTHATIENNVITGNQHQAAGGGIAECYGLIQNNVISWNVAGAPGYGEGHGGGLYDCDGVIRNNVIVGNLVHNAISVPDPSWYPGEGGGLAYCDGIIEGNLIYDNEAIGEGGGLHSCNGIIRNNTIVGNLASDGGGLYDSNGTIVNCIVWANISTASGTQLYWSSDPTYSCVQGWTCCGEGSIWEDPRFVDAENGDFRLRADSPCIDAGFNSPDLSEFDIAGMHRIMYGGKSLTVDMGAYEFYINKLDPVPGTNDAVFTWSSLEGKTYSIFYTDDLSNWHTAIANFPSSGDTTTSWLDDGTLTGIPPLLAPKRFYRLLENP